MFLHFVVISLFEERQAGDAKLGPMDPDLAHQSVSATLRMFGIRPGAPQDPMWYLVRERQIIGYVRIFREERFARNWFRDLAEQKDSRNFWAFWRDGHPLALIKGANANDANQFVKMIAICRVRAFSAQSAAENGWMNWIAGRLTAIEIFLDRPRKSEEQPLKQIPAADLPPSRRAIDRQDFPITVAVEPSKWHVTREDVGEGKRPSVELSRNYMLPGRASPGQAATFIIVCRLESEGLVDIDSENGALKLFRQLRFYFRPFPLLQDTDLVMELSTTDQTKSGEFDVVASPVDADTIVFAKYGGRNDVKSCLDILMSGHDITFNVSNNAESLISLCLPNDGEFKELVDEAGAHLARVEYAFKFMRPRSDR